MTALRALGWILASPERADRLITLTGLAPDDLRARLEDPRVLAGVLAFLEAHEPDLIACAEALALQPDHLLQARRKLDPCPDHC